MSLSTHLFRSLFALPLLLVALQALLAGARPDAAQRLSLSLLDAPGCSAGHRPMRPLPLTQVPADVGQRRLRDLPACRG